MIGPHTRVLDLGCAVGRASFELGRYFENVTGVDFSHSFINAANRLKQVHILYIITLFSLDHFYASAYANLHNKGRRNEI
jgi:2-polyprenyl-3-methyl-5-hydroxy-6-metoxy-1,4-benzoquinol methylase